MKRPYVVLAVLIAAATFNYAQTTDRKPPPQAATNSADAGVEQALTKIEHETLAALLKRDYAAFGRHFADEAVLVTPDGSPQTKTQLLADLKSGDLVIESSAISDLKVQVFGDAAVVTYITTDKGKYKKTDISGRYRWTDVFVRRAGAWKIVAGQGTPIAPPPK
jgi:ketosteroid isomerase-like protein